MMKEVKNKTDHLTHQKQEDFKKLAKEYRVSLHTIIRMINEGVNEKDIEIVVSGFDQLRDVEYFYDHIRNQTREKIFGQVSVNLIIELYHACEKDVELFEHFINAIDVKTVSTARNRKFRLSYDFNREIRKAIKHAQNNRIITYLQEENF